MQLQFNQEFTFSLIPLYALVNELKELFYENNPDPKKVMGKMAHQLVT